MIIRINPEKFLAWAEELKTTTKPQTRGSLKDDKGYCCLGILCELEGVKSEREAGLRYSFDGCTASLPYNLQMRMGEDTRGSLSDEDFSPVYFNDTMGMTFPEIAEKIEEYVEMKIEAGEVVS